MSTVFRSRGRAVGWRRRRFVPASAPALRPAVFAMSGTATVPGVGGSIASAVFSAAGVGAFTGTGRAIKLTVLSAAGVGAASYVGQPFFTSMFSMAGAASVSIVKGLDQITSTGVLQKPVNAVLAGDQDKPTSFRPGRAAGRGLRKIFGE